MKFRIDNYFENLEKNILNNQKSLDVNCNLKVFYGITDDGFLRLSFLSSITAPQIEGTKMIRIVQ